MMSNYYDRNTRQSPILAAVGLTCLTLTLVPLSLWAADTGTDRAETTMTEIRRLTPVRLLSRDTELENPVATIKPMTQIDLGVADPEEVTPPDLASRWLQQYGTTPHVAGTSRDWSPSQFRWAAAAVAYHPLYFENVNLERYGYTYGCLQPAASYAHFFGNVLLLPYHAVELPYCQDVYSLGYARPGSCVVPWHTPWFPLDPYATATEVAAVAGAILLIP